MAYVVLCIRGMFRKLTKIKGDKYIISHSSVIQIKIEMYGREIIVIGLRMDYSIS